MRYFRSQQLLLLTLAPLIFHPIHVESATWIKNSKSFKKNDKDLFFQAKKREENGQFSEAILLYEQLLKDPEQEALVNKCSVAKLYLLLNRFEEASSILKGAEGVESRYLLALCYLQQNRLSAAKELLESCVDQLPQLLQKSSLLQLIEMAALSKDWKSVEDYLSTLKSSSHHEWNQRVELLKAYYQLKQGKELSTPLPEQVADSQRGFLFIIKGLELVQKEQLEDAEPLFMQVWASEKDPYIETESLAYQSLAHIHLFLAVDPEKEKGKQLSHLLTAQELLQQDPHPSLVTKCHLHITQWRVVGDADSLHEAQKTLSQLSSPLDLSFILKLLNKNEIGKFFTERKQLQSTVLAPVALSFLEKADAGGSKKDLEMALYLIEQLLALDLPTEERVPLLFSHIKGLYIDGSRRALEKTYSDLEALSSLGATQESDYYRGLTLTKQAALANNPQLLNRARKFLKKASAPQNLIAAKALFALASNEMSLENTESAKKYFVEAAECFGPHPLGAEALYFAAVTSKKGGQEVAEIQETLKHRFPKSRYNADLLLLDLPHERLILADKSATLTLQKISTHFSHTPAAVEANFLLGLNSKKSHRSTTGALLAPKDEQGALNFFERAYSNYLNLERASFSSADEQQWLASLALSAKMEKAKLLMDIAEQSNPVKKEFYLRRAGDTLVSLQNALQKELLLLLDREAPLLEINQLLGSVQVKLGKEALAESYFTRALEHAKACHMTRSPLLSKSLFELAKLQFNQKHPNHALSLLNQAKEALPIGQGYQELLLVMWMTEADWQLKMKEPSKALILLSNAINEDIASPLRLKAMYLRGRLYQEEGQDDLAYRQFKTLSRFSGDYANLAKEKVREYEHARLLP